MASWPSSLPQDALATSLDGLEVPSAAVWSPPDIGPRQGRRRFTASPEPWPNMTFFMTRTQFQTLISFFRTTTADGTLPFDFTHPLDGQTYQWRITEKPRIVRSHGGQHMDVNVPMEALP